MTFLLENTSSLPAMLSNTEYSSLDISENNARSFINKLKCIIDYDKNSQSPMIQFIRPGFLERFTHRFLKFPQKSVVIGISGESASGKTTICNTIKDSIKKLELPIEILSADNYFNDISEQIKIHGSFDKLLAAGYDVDSPNNFNLEQLFIDLSKLSKGEDVRIPQYLVDGSGISKPNAILKKSQKIIIVEGMASMYGKVADLLDVKLYIDINPQIQEKWFIQRACSSRNQTVENAKKQLDYVRKASKKYIQPKKSDADIIINGASSLNYFSQILEYFYNLI